MSSKKDPSRNDEKRRVTIVKNRSLNNTPDSSYIGDITQDFDCLKISILNKAARVSGEFNKITLGPRANYENGNCSDGSNEVESSKNNNSTAQNGKSSSRSNLTFSIKKILLENEIVRKEMVKKAVDKKRQEMEASQRGLQEELSQLLTKMIIKKEKENEEKLIQLEAEEEQIALQLEQDRKNELEMQKMKESEEVLKKIIPFKENFHAKWKDIANIHKACRDQDAANRLLNSYSERLKELSSQWELINEKAKAADLTLADLRMVELLAQSNAQLYQSFKANVEQIEILYDEEIARREAELKQAELELQQEAQRQKQIQEAENAAKAQQAYAEQQQIQNTQNLDHNNYQASEVDSASQPPPYPNASQPGAAVSQVSTGNQVVESSEYPDTESYQIYMDSKEFLGKCTSSFSDFVKNESMKKFKLQCQNTLNITINSISHGSREQLIDKYDKLKSFLSGKGNPNILLNPQAEAFSKNLLAKKILDQGNVSILSKPELAFPFAAIAVALWNDWPDFGQILLARFRTISPFFVPVFLMQRNDQPDEEYYKSLGFNYNEDGIPEESHMFQKRLGGFMYLYASILVTKQRQGINKPHPHGLGNAWRWLAATLNIEPRSDVADVIANLIHIVLEVTGSDLWRTYPNQFSKLLQVLNKVYYEKLKNFDATSAPINRLGDFLTTALNKGSIPPPKGLLPPNFW